MIKKWSKFLESSENVLFDGVDFGIPKYMLSNILLDIKDEFPGIYIDEMPLDKFKDYLIKCNGEIDSELDEDLDKYGGPKFVITIDKPGSDGGYREPVYFLQPKIHEILHYIDGLLSQYGLRVWGHDFFYGDTEYYIIIDKIN